MNNCLVVGIVPPDEQWNEFRNVWYACKKACVPVPDAVYDFFGGDDLDTKGNEIDIPHRHWSNNTWTGIEVDMDTIPESVKTIRFYSD